MNDLFDLKGRVSRQRLTLRSAELEREMKYDEIKKSIIEMYTMAISQMKVLQMRSESLVLANVQYEISEKNFANGTIESTDLSTELTALNITEQATSGASILCMTLLTRLRMLLRVLRTAFVRLNLRLTVRFMTG